MNRYIFANTEKTKGKAPPHAWKPGQSGNPSGRPKDQFSFMGILRSALAEENKSGHSVGERIVRRYIKLALQGNQQAAEALMARIDGKPAQSLTLKGDSDAPLHVRHSARLEQPAKPKPELDAPMQAGTLTFEPAPEQEQEAAAGEVVGEMAPHSHLVDVETDVETETTSAGTGPYGHAIHEHDGWIKHSHPDCDTDHDHQRDTDHQAPDVAE